MLIISFLTGMFTGFLVFINQRYTASRAEEAFSTLQDVSYIINKELSLAASAVDGYNRTFKLPEKINGKEYNITIDITRTSIFIQTKKQTVTTMVPEFTGVLSPGKNNIIKDDGVIIVQPLGA